MKNLIYILFIPFVLCITSCSNCEEVEAMPCGERIPNSEHCGWTVATYYAQENIGEVAVIFDTRFNSIAPRGDDWVINGLAPIHPPSWVASKIGQVFGIAIDKDQNIYLGASDAYGYDSNAFSPYPQGQVFKCDPMSSWDAQPFITVPNTGGAFNGTGNIAYDKWNDQLFVTNVEDGKIYQFAMDGTPGPVYDPWAADNGLPGVAKGEEVWGIAVNKEGDDVKLYFAKIDPMARELYSLTLVNGALPSATNVEQLEISGLPGIQPRITDLAISSEGSNMLLAERGSPHHSTVFSADLAGGIWSLSGTSYYVGANAGLDGGNSAGGVDFAYSDGDDSVSNKCEEYFWASGNYMKTQGTSGLVYGLEGISYTGNNSASFSPINQSNSATDLFIDMRAFGGGQKGSLGDVEVFDCTACGDPCSLNDKVN